MSNMAKNMGWVLAVLIAVLLVAVLVVTMRNGSSLGGHGPSNPDGQRSSDTKSKKVSPPKLVDLKSGETVTQDKIRKEGFATKEPTPVDTTRLQATYKTGKTYVNLLEARIKSKGKYKDWGVETSMNFNYCGDFQLSRYIVSNDGRRMVMEIQIDRAVTVSIFTTVEGVHLALPPMFQPLLEIGNSALGLLPPGGSSIMLSQLDAILDSEFNREFLNQIVADNAGKAFANIDSLNGKRARVVFENGKGVLSITPIGCSLNSDEQLYFEGLSLCADITMMESLDCKPGDLWKVSGRDFLNIFDPSIKGTVGGSVSIVRREDLKDGSGTPKALLEIAGGVLTLHDRVSSEDEGCFERKASWSPAGQLVFDFNKQIVTEADMGGTISIVEHSLDHILFEMRNSVRPTYRVKYSAWIMDGNQLDKTPKIVNKITQGVLDRIKK